MSESDKTESPTPKRLREARQRGDVLQSRDLSTALVTGAGVLWLSIMASGIVAPLATMMHKMLHFDANNVQAFAPWSAIAEAVGTVARPTVALLALTLVAAALAPAILGSLGLRLENAAPKWSRIDPAAGLARVFGTGTLGELGKSIAKVMVVGGGCVILLVGWRWQVIALASGDSVAAAHQAGAMLGTMLMVGAAMLGLIAAIDVPWQASRRTRRLMMTRDEVMRENREADGAPEMKQARRSRQYALSTMSARSAMKEATVVLVNPAHFAVALRYDPDRDSVPMVVARGVDEAAAAIRDLATGNAVPCLEYPALTRALYFTSKAGDCVREDLFLAVATVLAFVMNLETALAAGRGPPEIDVPEALRFGSNGVREA